MGDAPPSTALEIHEDLVFQRREWMVERIGWAIVLAIVLAGLLGAWGSGPLSGNRLGGEGDALRVEYERLGRAGQPNELRLMLAPRSGDAPRLEIARSYLESIRIEAIVPEPEKQVIGSGDFVEWRFEAAEGQPRPFTVVVYYRHVGPGRRDAQLRFEGQAVQFWQWVYP